jgi:hypothetical protein
LLGACACGKEEAEQSKVAKKTTPIADFVTAFFLLSLA